MDHYIVEVFAWDIRNPGYRMINALYCIESFNDAIAKCQGVLALIKDTPYNVQVEYARCEKIS